MEVKEESTPSESSEEPVIALDQSSKKKTVGKKEANGTQKKLPHTPAA